MKTTAIIVTYGNRYNFVEQVIKRLFTFDLQSIIVVNNHSEVESVEQLELLASKIEYLKIINLDRNTGAGFGFNQGIKKVLNDGESDFIWLLDDDNLPEPDSFEILQKRWVEFSTGCHHGKLILSPLRSDRKNYIDAVEKNDPQSIIGENNIFRSFHIKKYFPFIKKKIYDKNRIYGEISAVPYGGMFFHKNVIYENGFLDDRYFIYCDDFDFCCRFKNNGGKIILLLETIIIDIEKSWNAQGRAIKYIACGESAFRIYYSIRNRVFLEKKNLVTSWAMYYLNMFIYSAIVTLLALSKLKFYNIKTYYTAIYHGLSGKMGYNENYKR